MAFKLVCHVAVALSFFSQSLASPYARYGARSSLPSRVMGRDEVAADQSAGTVPTLLPAVHWDEPVDDLQQLAPQKNTTMYYSEGGVADPTTPHNFAVLNAALQYESVVLNHSSFVHSVTCNNRDILITFTERKAYDFAIGAWPDQGEDFVLVTDPGECGISADQRTFWLVDFLTPDEKSLTIAATTARAIEIMDAIQKTDMTWGTYQPTEEALKKRGLIDDISNAASTDKDFSLTADRQTFSVGSDADTPWGKGHAIVSGDGLDLYCVDCYMATGATVTGHMTIGISGLSRLDFGLAADLDFQMKLGVIGSAGISKSKLFNIVTEAFPGLGISVGGLLTCGVDVALDLNATVGVNAAGQALLGAGMQMPNFKANMDFVNHGMTVQGNDPQWSGYFDADGKIVTDVTLGLPVSFNVGCTIPKLLDKKVSLVDQPSLTGEITVSGDTGSGCSSIDWLVYAANNIWFQFLNLKRFDLSSVRSPVLVQGSKQFNCLTHSIPPLPPAVFTTRPTSTNQAVPTTTATTTVVSATPIPTTTTTTTTPAPTATVTATGGSSSAPGSSSTATSSGSTVTSGMQTVTTGPVSSAVTPTITVSPATGTTAVSSGTSSAAATTSKVACKRKRRSPAK